MPTPPSSSRGIAVRIFLPDGDPNGIKIVEKQGGSGLGVFFPRSLHGSARKREELTRPGVYLLTAPVELGWLPSLYIGEGDPIGPRLDEHAAKKAFWRTAVAFMSGATHLNKAHIQYLEARLIHRAIDAKRCTLQNANKPQPPALCAADAAIAEAFFDEIMLCLPALAITAFELAAPVEGQSTEFAIISRGIEARGFETSQGFVVRRGSQAVATASAALQEYYVGMRDALVRNGVFEPSATGYVLTQDYCFSSPSMAASVLLGRSSDGRVDWKTPDRRSLKDVQEAQAAER